MSYTPTKSTDHEERGPARFLEQFKRADNLGSILKAHLRQIQKLEDCLWEVITLRNIADGFGLILDWIGSIVGRSREGLPDEEYRIALRAQIRINRSNGKTKDLVDVATLSVPDETEVTYSETYPAGVWIEVVPKAAFNWRVLWRNLKATKAGGVRLFLVLTFTNRENTFTFAPFSPSYPDPIFDSLRGFGWDVNPDLGGKPCYVLGS